MEIQLAEDLEHNWALSRVSTFGTGNKRGPYETFEVWIGGGNKGKLVD
jgi:hypothetical protein